MDYLPNILIVDDTEANLTFLEVVLKKTKANLISARSGYEALKKIKGIELSLAIIDVRMPSMSGYELAIKMNEKRSDNKVPIIFLTAAGPNDIGVIEGYNSGAVDYIFKPVNYHILLSKIEVFLNLFEQKQIIVKDALALKKSADELTRINKALVRSEEKYRSYVDNAPDGVFVVNELGKYIEVNEAACRITGYSKNELLKMSISDMSTEESSKDDSVQFKKIRETGAATADMRFKYKNGTTRWWTVEAIKLSETRFLGFTKDITDRKQAEEEVKRKSEFLERLIQQSPLSTFVLDDNGILLVVNEAFLKFYAVPDKDLILGTNALTVPQNIEYGVDKHIREALNGNEIDVLEQEYISPYNNNKIFVKIKFFPIFSPEGKVTNVVVIQENITERKQAEKELIQSELQYRTLGETIDYGAWTTDATGYCTYCSSSFLEMTGMTMEQIQKFGWLSLLPPEDVEPTKDHWISCVETGADYEKEHQFRAKDGSYRNVLAIGRPIKDDTGKIMKWVGINLDITQRKQVEKEQKDSDKRFRSVYENTLIGLYRTTQDGRILMANPTLVKMLGFSSFEELAHRNLEEEGFDPNYQHSVFMGKIERDGQILEFESAWIKQDGTKLFVSESAKVVYDDTGTILYFDGIVHDITQRKQMEDELKRTNLLLDSIIENIPDMIFLKDAKDLTFVRLNKAGEELLGYSRDELFGKNDYDFFTKKEADFFTSKDKKTLKGSGLTYMPEESIHTKNKGIRILQTQKIPILDKYGKSEYLLGISSDITQRIQFENERRDSEIKFRNLFETMIQGVVHQDKKGKIISANPSAEHILGLSLDQMQGRTSTDPRWKSIHEDGTDFPGDTHPAMVALKTGKPVSNAIMGVFNPKIEETRWININSIPLFNPGKKKAYQVYSTFEDITKRMHSEEEHGSIIKAAMDGFIMSDSQGRFLDVNNAYCNLIGYSREELLKMSFKDVDIQENSEEIEPHIQLVRDFGYDRFETQHRCKDGRTINIEISVNFVLTEGGRYYAFIRDITERKIAEHALKVSEEKYKTMLNASPDGILIFNMKGIIIEVSDIGLELIGADFRSDLLGKHFSKFVPSAGRNKLKKLIEKTMDEGLEQNIEIQFRKQDRSTLIGEINSTLIQDPDGKSIAFMVIIRDISQRKKMEIKQIHSDRMASLGEMASGIAHEINQPLNIISMVMDNVLYEATKEEIIEKEYLKKKSNKIFENITRIRNIIDHVKAFSRSRDDYLLTAFDINVSIQNTIMMISEQFKHLAISLNLQLEESIPLIIGNNIKFEQVILNLLSNAKDALLEKKGKLSEEFDMFVGIRSFLEDQDLIIEISDNGTGISEEDSEHIMLPFYTTKDTGKGTGLGLSISYRIIQEMNGTIEVSSNIFDGSTFHIIINLQNKE
ncbi:MAG: PAS domain S-box protein [Candidatus Marinimicrobia bacterium]|nr:PAS domain S-box protein [Candidatus Neomarinimicrobiota bacterium]